MPKRWRRWSMKRCAGPALAFAALDRLAVTTGPGHLHRPARRPCLHARPARGAEEAADRRHHTGSDGRPPRGNRPRAAAIHDAKRDEVYLSLCGRCATAILRNPCDAFDEASRAIRAFGACALGGTGAAAGRRQPGRRLRAVRYPPARRAVGGAAGAHRAAAGSPPAPLYLRAPDAKIPAASARRSVRPAQADVRRRRLARLHEPALSTDAWDVAALAAARNSFADASARMPFAICRGQAASPSLPTVLSWRAPRPAKRKSSPWPWRRRAPAGHGPRLDPGGGTHALDWARCVLFLEVRLDNVAALALYRGWASRPAAGARAIIAGESQDADDPAKQPCRFRNCGKFRGG